MAWTEADRDALREAIVLGASKVRYADGREATYRSLEEMRSILRQIEEELAGRRDERTSVVAHLRW